MKNQSHMPTSHQPRTQHLTQSLPLVFVAAGLCALVTLIAWLIVAAPHRNSSSGHWHHIQAHGPAQALQQASLLPTADGMVLVWQPADRPTPLVAEHLTTRTQTGILPYPDVHPTAWHALPATANTFHIIWLEQDDRLRSALIAHNGETLRGPIELAVAAVDFKAVLGKAGTGQVFWRTLQNDLRSTALDAEGRPNPEQTVLARRVREFATLRVPTTVSEPENAYFLAWFAQASAFTWELHATRITADTDFNPSPQLPIATVPVESDETLTYLGAGTDSSKIYVLWALATVTAPDRVQPDGVMLSWSDIGAASPLSLASFADGYDTPIRWLYLLAELDTPPMLALTIKTANGWRLSAVSLTDRANNAPVIISELPADAGPPVLGVTSDRMLWAAWSGLQAGRPTLFTARKSAPIRP